MQALSGFERTAALSCCLAVWSASIFALTARAASGILGRRFAMPAAAWLLAAVLAAPIFWRQSPGAPVTACVCIALLAGGIVDGLTGYLVDAATLPAAALALFAALLPGGAHHACGGVLAGAGTFGLLHVATRGRAVGLGDVKALYSFGAASGPLQTALALALASTSALLWSLIRGTFARRTEVRFGPHLAAGAALIFLTTGN